jgi:hypothetical protein
MRGAGKAFTRLVILALVIMAAGQYFGVFFDQNVSKATFSLVLAVLNYLPLLEEKRRE